ncbi:MAG: RNB domain-containing ribonuclease [Acidobacteriota bacterium]|nr:RNB domain-containing ribonuclease [Acidobacteriota bacterium]
MTHSNLSGFDLQAAARQEMIGRGFEPGFSPEASRQAQSPQPAINGAARDMRNLPWSSIDNDTSRDLDQIEAAERLDDGSIRIRIGIADVDLYVAKGSPIDNHAAAQTATIYTGVKNFSMLPDELSTGLTSLLENVDRHCIVIEMVIDRDANIASSDVYAAVTRNRAQLTYRAVGAWLEGSGAPPAKVAASAELQDQINIQDEAAQRMRAARYRMGALNLDSIETQPVLSNGRVTGIESVRKNRASELIEDFMIAANGVIAKMLEDRHVSSIRRVVKTPERWGRIVELAAKLGETLPAEPNSGALNAFLLKRKAVDPMHSADLSLAVVKLMGPGEYVLERPGDVGQGHFGLAVHDYTHSTAPNRRFADLVTQRLIKAVLANAPSPYSDDELAAIARNCTLKEDQARKIERVMSKRIAAAALQRRVGESFQAIVTGVTPKGTFVRVLDPTVEGRLMRGEVGVDVGDAIRVKLVRTDVVHGFIDFERN